MPRDGAITSIHRVSVDGVFATFANEETTVSFKVPDEVGALHIVCFI
jgi:hypothetical protein